MAPNSRDFTTQLYLVLELAGAEPSIEKLSPLFDGNQVPSLLIVPDASRTPDTSSLQALVAVAQHAGVAVLIADDEALAANVSADGVHITSLHREQPALERYQVVRQKLGANAIIGVDAGSSRHDAMALGEAGADYVAFGKTTNDHATTTDGSDTKMPIESQDEIVAWWADIFEIPVVALDIADDETAKHMAEVRADFVARKVPTGMSTADLRDWLKCTLTALVTNQSAQ